MRASGGQETDAQTIADFNIQIALETEQRRLDPPVVLRGVRAALADASGCRYYVARIDGQVCGQLMITLEYSDWRAGTFWWIQSVYVDAGYRRRGVYRALHRFVVAEAQERGGVRGLKLYVDRDNKGAQSVYASLAMSHSNYDLWEIDFESSKT